MYCIMCATFILRLNTIMEFDCIGDGILFFIKHCKLKQINFEKSSTIIEYGSSLARDWHIAVEVIVSSGRCKSWEYFDTKTDPACTEKTDDSRMTVDFPVLVINPGSTGFSFIASSYISDNIMQL